MDHFCLGLMPDSTALSYWYEFIKINVDFIDKQKVLPNAKCNLFMYIYFQFSLFEPTVKPVLSSHSKKTAKIGFQY